MLSDFVTHTLFQVGGLPQAELNQLELQFLLLNNFDLVISSDEMQRYAETLFKYSDSHAVISENEYSDASTPSPARPLQSMGAIDAYGGSVATEGRFIRLSSQETCHEGQNPSSKVGQSAMAPCVALGSA